MPTPKTALTAPTAKSMSYVEAMAMARAGKHVRRPHHHEEHTKEYDAALSPQQELEGVKPDLVQEPVVLTAYVWCAPGGVLLFHTVDGRDIPWRGALELPDLEATDWVVCGQQ